MFTVELTEQQLRSLKMFLERSEMRGFEVNSFLSLVQTISGAQSVEISKKEVEEK